MRAPVVAVLLVLAGGILAAWVVAAPTNASPRMEVAVVIDLSATSRVATRCEEIEAIAESAIPEGANARVRWFATGTRATGHEPTRVGPWAVAVERRMLHPRGRPPRPWEGRCAELGTTDETPLFRAVFAALGELRTLDGERLLFVRSDLLEEEDPVLRERLHGATAPPRLDNSTVSLRFCGVTQRDVRPGSRVPSAAALEAVWRAELVDPSTAVFTAGCP